MRYRTCLLAIALSLCAPESALAQPVDVHAQAEDHFRLGREALARGEHQLALRLFRVSYGLEPGRGKLINIAVCEEQVGLFASSFKHFREVQAQLPAGDDREPIVKQHLDAVGPQVPYLKVQLAPGAPAEVRVTLDGEPLAPASLGVETPIDPGKHVVAATASGAMERRYEITVNGGEHRAVEVAPRVAVPEGAIAMPAGPVPELPAPRSIGWTLGVVGLAVGGASLVAGAATGGAAAAKRASTVKLCPMGPTMCPASEQTAIDAYDRLGAASTATFVIGGALAAAGVILVVTSRRGDKPAAGAWIAPVVGPTVIGARGRF
jgi:hypothetical protein